jgi:biotin carboxylase
MKEDLIIIIGAGLFQVKSIREAKALGLLVLAFDQNPNAVGREHCDFFEQVSTKDIQGLIVRARDYTREYNVRGVMTAGTDVAYAVACVADALRLPGVTPDAAFKATNKFQMRKTLAAAGLLVPRFSQATTIEEALDAARTLGYPLVIKPVDNMGARGVRRVDSDDEIREHFALALEHSGHYSDPAVIIEEFMTGSEISMDTLVENGEIHLITVADRHIDNLPYFIEKGHSIPSMLSKQCLDQAFETMKKAIRAVGIESGAAKADIKITAEGAKIGEITARLSGGFHSQFTEYLATGMNSTRAAVQLAISDKLDRALITPSWDRVAIERAVIAEPGRIERIRGLTEAHSVPGIEQIIFNLHEGDTVYPLRSNLGKVANVIATGQTREQAEEAVRQAMDCLHIDIEDMKIAASEIN